MTFILQWRLPQILQKLLKKYIFKTISIWKLGEIQQKFKLYKRTLTNGEYIIFSTSFESTAKTFAVNIR